MFDRLEGTNLRQQRDERRRQERILRMAEKIDLLPTTYCAKHEKALKRAHELV